MDSRKSVLLQFLSGTFAIGLARMSTIAFGLVSVMITVRAISADDYGIYVLLIVILGFLVEFTNFGLSMAIARFMASHAEEADNNIMINTLFYFRIFTILATSVLIVVFKDAVEALAGRSLLLELFIYLPFLFSLSSLSQLFQSILRGQFRFGALAGIEFGSNGIELLFVALLVLHFRLGLHGLLVAKLISSTFVLVSSHAAARIRHKWGFDRIILKDMLKFGFPLQLQYVMFFLFSRVDTVVIGSLLGASGVAYYEVARKFPDSLFQLFDVFNSVYFPISSRMYANERKENTERLINNSIRLLTFFAALAALIAVLFGRDIILLFFSSKYLVSYSAFVLLTIGLSLKYLDNLLGYSLIAIGEPAKPLIVNIVRAIVNLIGNLAFLPMLGFTAAAAVSVVSNMAAVPLDAIFLLRRQIRPRMLEFAKPMALFAVFSLAFLAMGSSSLVLKTGLAILYFPMCLLLSVFTARELSTILAEARTVVARALGRPAMGHTNPE